MAEGVLATLEKEFRPLLAPKLLSEAKAAQVVWARVKGYPAWPAQVLTEAAALRRKDLGQERHSKGNSVPVMFFGTMEVAWVKDADVVDFKEGLHQGFFDRKTKPFKLALEQVCDYLALDRKRKAPPKWWCKPPSNGLDEQSDGPSPKPASASGSGAAKGAGQRHDATKGSRQRTVTPESDSESSSSDDDDDDGAPVVQGSGKAGGGKPAGGKDGCAASKAKGPAAPAPSTKPRDSSTARLQRDNGSTAVSTNTAAQVQAKKPPPAPNGTSGRQQPVIQAAGVEAKDARDGRNGSTAATSGPKVGQPVQTSQQQQKQPKLATTGAAASAKENDAGLPPRKRLKVEASHVAAAGPAAASASSLPPPPPLASKGLAPRNDDATEMEASGAGATDVVKLPAEIRRLAGIRLPAVPKKPGAKAEELPRQLPVVKAEQAAASTAAMGAVAASAAAKVKREDAVVQGRAGRSSRGATVTARRCQSEGTGGGAGSSQGKRSRRARSASKEESPSTASSDGDDDREGCQSSGEEADSEAAASVSDSSGGSEADSDDDMLAAAVRKSGRAAVDANARGCLTRVTQQTQPARDRRGEKQRRLARLAAPEPADRRTSSRLVPKAVDTTAPAAAKKAASEDDSEGHDGSQEDDEDSSDGESGGGSGSDGEAAPAAKASGSSGEGACKLRSSTRSPEAARSRPPHLVVGTTSRKVPAGLPSQNPSRDDSQQADRGTKAKTTGAETDGEAAELGEGKQQQRREGSGATAIAVVAKAVPLELRRLQNSPSGGPPVVDTTEPRMLRDRSSPARRAAGSVAATPTQTGTTGGTGGKRVEKRSSDDGSGVSMSPGAERGRALERAKSPEHRRDGPKGSSAVEAKPAPKPSRAPAQEGRSSKAGSAAGSASPPPGPLTGGVPVRKKPPSLGVPSSARPLGQVGVRQLPAIIPARGALRSLAPKRDAFPQTAASTGANAVASAAGEVAPVAVCVAKKLSAGPPTRRVVEHASDAPLSSTDLPNMVSVDGEADAKHASSPDVAAAAAVTGGGPMPLSPEEVSANGAVAATLEAIVAEAQNEAPAELRPTQQPLPSGEREVEHTQEADERMSEQQPVVENADQARCQDQTMVGEVSPAEEHPPTAQQSERGEEMDLDPQPTPGPEVAPATEVLGQASPQHGACEHRPDVLEPTEQPPALGSARSEAVAQAQEPGPPLSHQQPSASHQQTGPPVCSRPPSPIHDEVLLAQEQLPENVDPMTDHDGKELRADQAYRGGNPYAHTAAVVAQVAPAEPAEELLSHEVVMEAAEQRPKDRFAYAGIALARPPVGSDASSDAGDGDAPGGAYGGSCSANGADAMDEKAVARAHARELEELGEVAAALAGLQRAEVPRMPLLARPLPQADAGLPSVASADLERSRSRHPRGSYGRERSGGSRENLAASESAWTQTFQWPQPEPLLPPHDQPFALPGDWLLTRPPRYEPVKRNLWLSRAKPKRLPKDEINICACRPPPLVAPGELQRMGCVMNCLNRLSSVLCDPKLCPCGELCSNRSLHLLRPPKTEVFLTENRGWGVRALEPVAKNGFIIEYAGEVIDERELGRRMDHARMNGEPHFYIMELSAGLYIDARRKGNTARLINSSCDPNCETQKWHDAATGEVRVGIFATREIAPGEELVYDYFFSTYGALKPSAASFLCMCGSKNCRGTMDLHPEKRRDLGRRVEVFWDEDGHYYRAVIVAYHPTSRKHTIMYEDGGTEKLCLDEVPHRWMDDDQQRISPPKPNAPRVDSVPVAQPAPARPQQQPPSHPLQQPQRQSTPEPPQQQAQQPGPSDSAIAGVDRRRYAGGLPVPAVVAQPPPRAMVTTEQRCTLPPLGSSAVDGAGPLHGQLGKHGLQDGELHLPLKKRQRMIQQMSQQTQQLQSAQPLALADPRATSSRAGEVLPSSSLPQLSGGSSGSGVALTAGPAAHSGGGAESGVGDVNGLSGRTNNRHESSGTGSGRVSSVAGDEDANEDANEDLDSLLEAAEAVAALRTAPINHAPAMLPPQDGALPLQPRHIRSGPAGVAAAAGAVAMVQTAKVASPRHLVAVHRSGPPNGLPPHGGAASSRPGAAVNPHASSSSSGFVQYQAGPKQQPAVTAPQPEHVQQEAGLGVRFDQQPHARNGRPYDEAEGSGGAAGSGRVDTNGYGSCSGSNGGINREDLLWKLVGIEKPKDLLPLFAGGRKKSRNGDSKNGGDGGSDAWIAPSHPYGKLLRALEASELLPHADQLRLFAQQQNQQVPQQVAPQHHQFPQQPQPPVQPPRMQQPHQLPAAPQQSQPQPLAAATAAAVEALALSAWQHAAQQQTQHGLPQHVRQPTVNGNSFLGHGLDGSTAGMAALLHAQQHAAAAAAAASTGQLHHHHTMQSHGGHTSSAAVAGMPSQQLGPQQLAAAAAHWQQAAHAQQQGQIIQDLVHMYVAQHTAPHQMLAMAGTAAVGGPPRCA